MNYFSDISDLCGREKLLTSDNFSLKSKYMLKKEDKDYLEKKKNQYFKRKSKNRSK